MCTTSQASRPSGSLVEPLMFHHLPVSASAMWSLEFQDQTSPPLGVQLLDLGVDHGRVARLAERAEVDVVARRIGDHEVVPSGQLLQLVEVGWRPDRLQLRTSEPSSRRTWYFRAGSALKLPTVHSPNATVSSESSLASKGRAPSAGLYHQTGTPASSKNAT